MYHLFLGSTLSLIITAISSILVARLLGPQDYGLYGLALVAPGYFYSVIHFNTSTSTVRYAAKYSEEGDRDKAVSFAYSALLFQFLAALAAFLISLPLSGIIATDLLKRPELQSYIPVATASILGLALMNVSQGSFQCLGNMRKSAMIDVARALTRLVVSVGLILLGLSVLGAVIGYTACYIVAGVLGLSFVMYSRRKIVPSGFFSVIVTSLRYSLPLYAGTALSMVISPYADTLLANFTANQQMGGYFAASNLGNMVAVVAGPISTALFPLFSRLAKGSDKLSEAYSTSVKYSTLFIVPVTFAVMILATPIVSVVYGNGYKFSGVYLAALVAPSLLVGFGGISQTALLNGIGETRKSMLSGVANILAYIASATLFVPFLSVYGIALSSAIGSAAGLIVATRMVKGILGRGIMVRSVARIYLASAVASGLVYPLLLLNTEPLVTFIAGALLFVAACVPLLGATRSLTAKELSTLEAYSKNVGWMSFPMILLLRYYRFCLNIHCPSAMVSQKD